MIVVDNNGTICHHPLCKNQRAILINSKRVDEFSCKHVTKTIDDCSQPLAIYMSQLPDVVTYPCDDTTRNEMITIRDTCGHLPIAVQVSSSMYCVFRKAKCQQHNWIAAMSESQTMQSDVAQRIASQW